MCECANEKPREAGHQKILNTFRRSGYSRRSGRPAEGGIKKKYSRRSGRSRA